MRLVNEAVVVATQKVTVKNTAPAGICICNNLQYPVKGRSDTQLGRYLAPINDDGIFYFDGS